MAGLSGFFKPAKAHVLKFIFSSRHFHKLTYTTMKPSIRQKLKPHRKSLWLEVVLFSLVEVLCLVVVIYVAVTGAHAVVANAKSPDPATTNDHYLRPSTAASLSNEKTDQSTVVSYQPTPTVSPELQVSIQQRLSSLNMGEKSEPFDYTNGQFTAGTTRLLYRLSLVLAIAGLTMTSGLIGYLTTKRRRN